MFIESFNPTGHVIIRLNDDVVYDGPNIVTTAGKALIASRMVDANDAVVTHLAAGSDNTAAAAGNTALGNELGRAALTSLTHSTNTFTAVATLGAGTATGSVVEFGLLNASSGGTLLCRTVVSTITKGSSDSITVTWVLTAS
tara:strand:- start:961 stop:1386 length:426 start_codon:yes stop_codon:yes gene_type:complete